MNIGAAIRSIREGLCISQKELGTRCYISQSNLSRIESGTCNPSPDTVTKICRILDIPESLVYIMAMQEADVVECKKRVYKVIFPMIRDLALQIATTRIAAVL